MGQQVAVGLEKFECFVTQAGGTIGYPAEFSIVVQAFGKAAIEIRQFLFGESGKCNQNDVGGCPVIELVAQQSVKMGIWLGKEQPEVGGNIKSGEDDKKGSEQKTNKRDCFDLCRFHNLD